MIGLIGTKALDRLISGVLMKKWLIVGLLCGASSQTFGKDTFLTAREAVAQKSAPVVRSFVSGIQEGMTLMHAVNSRTSGKMMYCLPDNLAITADQTLSILERFLDQNPQFANDPVSVALLGALAGSFPCKN